MFRLTNKIAVITGAGSGIGKAIALVFAKEGAKVHIIDLNAESAQEVANEIQAAGGLAVVHACNVTDQLQVKQIFERIGVHDILVNNAGIAHVGKAGNTTEEDFDRVMNVNVKGVYNCLFAAIPLIQRSGGGVIINMGSIAGHVGLSDRFVYTAAKGAVMAMTMSVAKDYLQDNIRCNSISPARVHTPFVDGFIAKNYPSQEKRCLKSFRSHNPLAGWRGLMKLPRWPFTSAATKHPSSQAAIMPSMADSLN